MNINKPLLTEPGIKYFINDMLKQCHNVKEKYQNMIINVGLFVMFFVILGSILIYKYKGKLTKEEMKEKERIKNQYVLSKIQNYKIAKLKEQQSLITGLPHWDNEL